MLCELGARGRQMLAIVEDEQQSPVVDEFDQCVGHRAPRFFLDAKRRRDRLRHQSRVGNRRELDEPHAIGILVDHVSRDLQ